MQALTSLDFSTYFIRLQHLLHQARINFLQ